MAAAFWKSCNPTSAGESRSAMMPDPTTPISKSAVPANSATSLRISTGSPACEVSRGATATEWPVGLPEGNWEQAGNLGGVHAEGNAHAPRQGSGDASREGFRISVVMMGFAPPLKR